MLSAWSQLLVKHAQEHDSGLETDEKLVNHSTRKHLVQKLVENDTPPGEIIQITRHKNVNSKQLLIFIRQETAADFRCVV